MQIQSTKVFAWIAHTHTHTKQTTNAAIADVLKREWLKSLKISSWDSRSSLHTRMGGITHPPTPTPTCFFNVHCISLRGQWDLSLSYWGGRLVAICTFSVLLYSIVYTDWQLYLLIGVTQIILYVQHQADIRKRLYKPCQSPLIALNVK